MYAMYTVVLTVMVSRTIRLSRHELLRHALQVRKVAYWLAPQSDVHTRVQLEQYNMYKHKHALIYIQHAVIALRRRSCRYSQVSHGTLCPSLQLSPL